jgi:hypothetical protein
LTPTGSAGELPQQAEAQLELQGREGEHEVDVLQSRQAFRHGAHALLQARLLPGLIGDLALQG